MLGSDYQRREFLFGVVHILFTVGSDMPAVRSMYFPRSDMYARGQQIHLECIRSLQAAIHLVASRGPDLLDRGYAAESQGRSSSCEEQCKKNLDARWELNTCFGSTQY